MKWLILFGGNLFGFILVRYSRQLVNIVGQNSWAERKLGPGGSYTMWKILGVICIVFAFTYFTGQINVIGDFFASIFAPSE